ncbi:hypothetical protein [Nocardia mexicana]|uniref:Uncharacterized protein n=1 Tax=Nocardia mexicana TaxID=279262 RepID=A0A370GXN8_9NOCA|nr:hypothetical protein [Nocardia mexicana]RDI48438.1 hypothetical protein DFR68_108271 [Nocardia mexicana]
MNYPYGPPGHPVHGHPEQGFQQPGYGPPGYPPPGQPQPGFPPSGQLQPGQPQPGYPPPGSPQVGYPPPGFPQSGYPPQSAPGGGSAITAGVLGLLVGVLAGIGTVASLGMASDAPSSARGGMQAAAAVSGVVALLWLLGAILLFARKTAGQVILVLLSGLGIIGNAVAQLATDGRMLVPGLIGIVFAAVILVFAGAKSTSQWIAAKRQPQYGYPPAPMYGQPPYPAPGQPPYPHY